MNDFIMLPKIDWTFKEIMANEMVRRGFLSAVLNIDADEIKETVLENTNTRVMHEDEKLSILDVRILLNNDTEIDIEIQIAYYGTWSERAVFYLARMLAEQTGINKTYSNMKKCIGINILDFKYTKDDKFYKRYHIREDNADEIFSDILEWHIIELPKLPPDADGSAVYNWARFIKAENKEELEMASKTDMYIGEAYKQLEVLSQNREKQIEYTSRQKAIMDYNTVMKERYEEGLQIGEERGEKRGIQIGEERGIRQRDSQLIIKWKKQGMSDEDIQKLLY